MNNYESIKKYEDYIISMRRKFHENPELSGQEFETLKAIMAELDAMGIPYVEVENGGILGFIKGSSEGKTVLLRADMDALPVKETENLNNTRCVWSKNDGVMHACGHDGHVAMLLGAAKLLLEKKDEIKGTVILCFERGEEGTGNAKYIWKYIEYNGIKIDTIYGTHLYSQLESGILAINDTNVMSGGAGFDVTIVGKGGHSSRPDQSITPIDCFTAINIGLMGLRMTRISPFETFTYAIGTVQAGIRSNVIPDSLRFTGGSRIFDEEVGHKFLDEMKKIIDNTCEAYNCKPIYNRFMVFGGPTKNEPVCAQFARKVINAEYGSELAVQIEPWMASESFGTYLQQWPGVFCLLGMKNAEKGVGAAHHNGAFDIDESVLATGAASAVTYAIEYLKNPSVTDTVTGKKTYSELAAEKPNIRI